MCVYVVFLINCTLVNNNTRVFSIYVRSIYHHTLFFRKSLSLFFLVCIRVCTFMCLKTKGHSTNKQFNII